MVNNDQVKLKTKIFDNMKNTKNISALQCLRKILN